MSQQNIMEITNLVDLKYIMSSCVTVIAGFTTLTTPQNLKVFIRKFLKRKSESFPLITFVYMEISDADRKTLNILKGGIKDYPRVYHIRGGNNIMVQVNAANEETIIESFNQVEKLYIDEMKVFQQHLKNKQNKINESDEKIDSNDDQIISDDPDEEDDEFDNLQKQPQDSQKQIQKQPQKQLQQKQSQPNKPVKKSGLNNNDNEQLDSNVTSHVEQQIDPVVEKKKNLEKLVLLNKKCDELKLNMVKDIAKRKKMEIIIDKKNDAEKKDDDGKEYRKSLRKTAK